MTKSRLIVGAVLSVALPALALGQSVTERLNRLEQKVEEQQKSLAGALGVDVHALASVSYQYSFNKPRPRDAVGLRSFMNDHDEINLQEASLFISRNVEDSAWGFNLVTDFGDLAEDLGAATLWGSSSESSNAFELREAYLTYTLPIADGITVKAGKFVTLLGYEIIPTWDNINENITRSILFGFAIPFTHTGITASVPLGDLFTVELGVVNGWDNVDDNNRSKTLLGGIGISPMENLSMYFAGTFGSEQANNQQRGVVTANLVYDVTDDVQIVLDAVYGNEDNLLPRRDHKAPLRVRHADWFGTAAYLNVDVTEDLFVSLRGEWFEDPDGVRTGAVSRFGNGGSTFWEGTVTAAYKLADAVTLRAEYRHDESSSPFFNKEGRRLLGGNDAVVGELVLAF